MKHWKKSYSLIIVLLLISGCRAITDAKLNGADTVTVDGGESIDVTVYVTTEEQRFPRDSGDWKSTAYTLDGSTTCVDHADHFGEGDYSQTFAISAPTDAGSYDLSMRVYEDDACSNTSTDSSEESRSDAITIRDSGGVTPGTCSAIFPGGVQSNRAVGEVKIKDRAEVNGGGSNVATDNLSENDGSCDGGSCSESSAAESSTVTVKTGSGSDGDLELDSDTTVGNSGDNDFGKIVLEDRNTLTFSSAQTEYFFNDSWDIKDRAVLLMAPGDYWVSGDVTFGPRAVLTVNGSGTVRIYATGTITLGERSQINASGSEDQLLLYSETKVELKARAVVKGFVYSSGDVIVTERAELTGAASAGATLEIKERATVEYIAPDSGDFGDFCSNSPASSVDHYGIYFNGQSDFSDATGLTCEPASVTLVAHDASHGLLAPPAGTTVNLSTSTGAGSWSSSDNGLTDLGGGNASYRFSGNDTATFQLSYTVAESVNVNVAFSGSSVQHPDEDPNIVFVDTGFRFLDASDNTIGSPANPFTQESGVESGTFYLQAVRKDTNTGACTGAFPDGGVKEIDLAAECIDPFTCAGEAVSLTNNSNTETIATNDGAPGYTNDWNVLFGTDSKAAFTLNYPDVGAIQLHAKYDILLENGLDSNVDMQGASNSFVVKPYDLVVSNVPGNALGLAGFVAAGENFTVEVESRNASGGRTPNFGLESVPENVELNFSGLEFPAGGVDGDFTSGNFSLTAAAGRLQTTEANWDEVGTIKVFASIADGNYQGVGDVTGTPSESLGRFYPDHFSITGSVKNACTAGGTNFSYFSDPSIQVSYTARAENVTDELVENYDDALGFPVQGIVLVAESSDGGTDVAPGRLNVASASWDDGVLAVTDGASSFLRSTLEAEISSLVVGVKADNAADDRDFDSPNMNAGTSGDCSAAGDCDAVALSNALRMRFGRLYTKDVHGPESASLPVILQTEYWNGSSWQLNTDDSCTSFGRALIEFNSNNIVSSLDVDFDTSSGADTTGTFVNLDASEMTLSFGNAGLVFSVPGAGKTGSFPVDVDISSMPWLHYDWNQDGNHDNNVPTVTVTFGSYRGHDRVIYWHERFTD